MKVFRRPSIIALAIVVAAAVVTTCLLTCSGYRYVKVSESLPPWKDKNLSAQDLEIQKALSACVENPVCVAYFKPFFTRAYLVIDDADSLGFTFDADAKPGLKLGFDQAVKPQLIVHMNRQNCLNLPGIFADNQVSDEEAYRIFRVTLLGSIRSELQMNAIYDPLVARMLALPNFIQLTLKNENHYQYQGTTKEYTISVVNINGQWIAFDGAIGNPDVRMAFTHKQAAEFRKMMFHMALNENAPVSEKKKNLIELKKFFDSITVYKKS
jgi:hypothetical protein